MWTTAAFCASHAAVRFVPIWQPKHRHFIFLEHDVQPEQFRLVRPLNTEAWTLVQKGRPESASLHVTTVHPVHIVAMTGNAIGFLESLGFRIQSELVKQGFAFLYRNAVKVTVSRIYEVR